MKKTVISIIVPTYNEKDNIIPLIREIHIALKGHAHEILIIDDNSSDGTWEMIPSLSLESVHLIRRINQRGLVSALQTGIGHAKGKIIGWMDADLSHPPLTLTRMLPQLKHNDVVIASRYVKGGRDERKETLSVIGSWLINYLARLFVNGAITDSTSGFMLIRKSILSEYRLQGHYGEYGIFLADYLRKRHASVKEIPYETTSRTRGITKTSPTITTYMQLSALYLHAIYTLMIKHLLKRG